VTKWTRSLTDARLAVDDYSVELRLRSIEPPLDKVEAELREVMQRERLSFCEGAPRRNCFSTPGQLQDVVLARAGAAQGGELGPSSRLALAHTCDSRMVCASFFSARHELVV
jgi:hypothetical protein